MIIDTHGYSYGRLDFPLPAYFYSKLMQIGS